MKIGDVENAIAIPSQRPGKYTKLIGLMATATVGQSRVLTMGPKEVETKPQGVITALNNYFAKRESDPEKRKKFTARREDEDKISQPAKIRVWRTK